MVTCAWPQCGGSCRPEARTFLTLFQTPHSHKINFSLLNPQPDLLLFPPSVDRNEHVAYVKWLQRAGRTESGGRRLRVVFLNLFFTQIHTDAAGTIGRTVLHLPLIEPDWFGAVWRSFRDVCKSFGRGLRLVEPSRCLLEETDRGCPEKLLCNSSLLIPAATLWFYTL